MKKAGAKKDMAEMPKGKGGKSKGGMGLMIMIGGKPPMSKGGKGKGK